MTTSETEERAARLARNLEAVRERARRAAGDVAPPELVAVTKSVSPELALELARAGARDLGENRLAELERKHAAFARDPAAPPVQWHFIGHLQRNKARRVVLLADWVHSVDGRALLETLARVAAEEDRRPKVFLQVKLTGEESKGGFDPEELPAAVELARRAAGLELVGLMTMAPWLDDEAARREVAARTFARLAELGRELPAEAFAGGSPQLSMGMSGDLEEAVRAGSHWLRIGTALFEGVSKQPPGGDKR